MPNYADFAAVAEVRESTIRQVMRIYHSADLFPTSIADTIVITNPIGPGQATIQYGLFFDCPLVVLEESNNNRIAFNLKLVGQAQVSATGLGNLSRQVMLTSQVKVRPQLVVMDGGVRVRVTVSDVSVASLDITEIGNEGLPANFVNVVRSADARNALSNLLRTALGLIDTMAPPLFVPMLESYGIGELVNLTALVPRVLDGVLAIGLDVSPGTISLSTSGNPAAITNFLSQSDIAVCVNPALVVLLKAKMLPEIQAKAAKKDVTIDEFWIQVESNNFHIGGHASHYPGGATFSLRARPYLGEPESYESYDDEYGGTYVVINPGTEDVWVQVYDIELDTELPWWLYVAIGIVGVMGAGGAYVLLPLVGFAIMMIVGVVECIRSNVNYKIGHSMDNVQVSRVQRITMPGTQGPFVDLTLTQLVVGSNGFQSRLRFRPIYTDSGKIIGTERLDAEEFAQIPNSPLAALNWGELTYRWTPAIQFHHPDDPLMRLRWQIRRLDTNEVILTKMAPVTTLYSDRVTLDLTEGANFSNCSEFAISCSLYRWGGWNIPLISRTVKLKIIDRLDRTHPYVRWKHTVFIPQVTENSVYWSEITDYHAINRQSAIHRTALPGRCRFVSQYSSDLLPQDDATGRPSLEYLDELPFPSSELVAHRDELCDYCFYGGPDKTVPKVNV